MTIPTPHVVTAIDPAETTDGYGDTVLDYTSGTRRDIAAYVQPQNTAETHSGDRNAVAVELIVFTEDNDVTARQRFEWNGATYRISGRPDGWDTPEGFHHTEMRLTRATG